jgi:hypothetical protein
MKSYPSVRPEESRCDLGTHPCTRVYSATGAAILEPQRSSPLVRVRTIKSTLHSYLVPSYRVPLSSPQIVCLSIHPIMTSFISSEPPRSRLEWYATLNPGAAPQTTEENKYHRKVRIAAHLSCPSPYLVIRHRSSRPSVSLRTYACLIWLLSYA